MNSVCLSTGSAQRALVSRHVKIRSLSKSSYAPFCKTALQPLRVRSAGRLRIICSNAGQSQSEKPPNVVQPQKIWEPVDDREPLSQTQKLILTVLWKIILPSVFIVVLASSEAAPYSSNLLLSFRYALIFNFLMACFNLSWIFSPVTSTFRFLFFVITKRHDINFGNILMFAWFFVYVQVPTSDLTVLSAIGMFFGSYVARVAWTLFEAAAVATVSTPTPDLTETEMEAKRKEQELKEFDARLHGVQAEPQGE